MNITAIRRPDRDRVPAVQPMVDQISKTWTATELQHTYLDDVYRFVSRRIAIREEAEDLTIDVFGAAFRSLPRFRGDADVKTWLFGIARRKIADFVRRTGRGREIVLLDVPLLADRQSEDPSPDTLALQSEAIGQMRRILSDLPEDQRDALLLQHLEGLSIAEIARVMGRSTAAVNSLLQRARATAFRMGNAYFVGAG